MFLPNLTGKSLSSLPSFASFASIPQIHRRPLDMVDMYELGGTLGRFESQTQLLHRIPEAAGRVWPSRVAIVNGGVACPQRELDIEYTCDPGLVDYLLV